MARIYFTSTSVTEVTLRSADWTVDVNTGLYVQTVSVPAITSASTPTQGLIFPSECTDTQRKQIQKNAAFICKIVTGDGTVTFHATKTPTVDLTIGLKGVY